MQPPGVSGCAGSLRAPFIPQKSAPKHAESRINRRALRVPQRRNGLPRRGGGTWDSDGTCERSHHRESRRSQDDECASRWPRRGFPSVRSQSRKQGGQRASVRAVRAGRDVYTDGKTAQRRCPPWPWIPALFIARAPSLLENLLSGPEARCWKLGRLFGPPVKDREAGFPSEPWADNSSSRALHSRSCRRGITDAPLRGRIYVWKVTRTPRLILQAVA